MGLSVCYSVVNRHNGCITVESTVEKGSAFYIYLPAVIKEKTPEKTPYREGKSNAKRRILVMDDEELIRDMVRSLLSQLGYEVEVTTDGVEVFTLCRSHQLKIKKTIREACYNDLFLRK